MDVIADISAADPVALALTRHRRRSTAEQRGMSKGYPARSPSLTRSPRKDSPLTVDKRVRDNVCVESPPLPDILACCSDIPTLGNLDRKTKHEDAYREKEPNISPAEGNSNDIGVVGADLRHIDRSGTAPTVGQPREPKRGSWSRKNVTILASPGGSVGAGARNKRSRVAITLDGAEEPKIADNEGCDNGRAEGSL